MNFNEKKFNLYFSVCLLAGMIILAAIDLFYDFGNKDTKILLQIIASVGAITGVANTVLSANGNIWTFVFGLLDVVCCSIVYWNSGIMGEFAIHVFYFLPMQLIGWWQWRKRGASIKRHLNEEGEKETTRVHARRMTPLQFLYVIIAFLLMTVSIYLILYYIDFLKFKSGDLAYIDYKKIILDASLVSLNMLGQILMSLAYMEQWYLWNIVNVFAILLWVNQMKKPGASGYETVMLIKYVLYLINSINGLRIWLKLSRAGENVAQNHHNCC